MDSKKIFCLYSLTNNAADTFAKKLKLLKILKLKNPKPNSENVSI